MSIVPYIKALWPVPSCINLTTYVQGMSDYEIICAILQKLNEVVHSFNSLDDAVADLSSKFDSLKSFVDNYFENLDVQEEINNKLDEMVESGEFTQILSTYFGSYYTPQMFGAVGDGVADDTDALEKWASQDAAVLYLSPGSSYKVTRPITIADKSIIGQGAHIISTAADTALLITNSDADHYGFARDFTIAVADTCQTALHLSTWRYQCSNINLTNVHYTGCMVDTGYENTLSHMYVDCKNCGVSSVGFHFRVGDCCLLDSVARDCHTGIICDANTYVRNYHAWAAWSALDNSAVFAIINSAGCVFDGCYADTYPNAFSITGQSMQTRLLGCSVYCNEYFYAEAKFGSLPPALITTPSDANTQCVHIVGASLKPVSFASPGVLIMRSGNYQGYIDQSSFAVASEPRMQCTYMLGVTGGSPDVSELTVHGDMLSLVFSAPAGTYTITFPYGALPSNTILYFSDGGAVKSATISPSNHSATIIATGYINCNFVSPRVYPQF